jgi:hypothetical protein
MLTSGVGLQFQDGGAPDIVGRRKRHAAGTEVQRHEDPLMAGKAYRGQLAGPGTSAASPVRFVPCGGLHGLVMWRGR